MAPRDLPEFSCRRQAELGHDGAIDCGLQLMAGPGLDPSRSAINSIGETCGLTPGEIRVLHAVVDVGGIRDTAAALEISPTTVKTHLRHIFQKTGVKGQVDLIRLIARTATCSER